MRIYVAGPYSQGDLEQNVRRVMDAGTALLASGHAPHPERTWLDLDLAWLEVAGAVLRLPGVSAGADCE